MSTKNRTVQRKISRASKNKAVRNNQITDEQRISIEIEAVNAWAEAVGTGFGTLVYLLFERAVRGDSDAALTLASYDFNPKNYLDYDQWRFKRDYQLWQYVKSYPSYPALPQEVRDRAAFETFLETERRCAQAEERVSRMLEEKEHRGFQKFFRQWQEEIKKILSGEFPWSQFQLRNGDGASVGIRGNRTHPIQKLDELTIRPHNTLLYQWLASYERWSSVCLDESALLISPGCTFAFVLKTALKSRGIAIQNTCDMQLQLGTGDAIGGRLCRFGIRIKAKSYSFEEDPSTLRSQKDLKLLTAVQNGLAALQSSVDDRYATTDQSSSSDHWARYIVERALALTDFSWQYMIKTNLDTEIRVPSFMTDEEKIEFNVFTSLIDSNEYMPLKKAATMGNGLIFPLQTLLYYAACRVFCSSGYIGVYGDDIVVEKKYARIVIAFLTILGHKINISKTYIDGPFKESCGVDAFNGMLIRKFKPKLLEGITNEERLLTFHNSLARLDCVDIDDTGWMCVTGSAKSIIRGAILRARGADYWGAVPMRYGNCGFTTHYTRCKGHWQDGIKYTKTRYRKAESNEPRIKGNRFTYMAKGTVCSASITKVMLNTIRVGKFAITWRGSRTRIVVGRASLS